MIKQVNEKNLINKIEVFLEYPKELFLKNQISTLNPPKTFNEKVTSIKAKNRTRKSRLTRNKGKTKHTDGNINIQELNEKEQKLNFIKTKKNIDKTIKIGKFSDQDTTNKEEKSNKSFKKNGNVIIIRKVVLLHGPLYNKNEILCKLLYNLDSRKRHPNRFQI